MIARAEESTADMPTSNSLRASTPLDTLDATSSYASSYRECGQAAGSASCQEALGTPVHSPLKSLPADRVLAARASAAALAASMMRAGRAAGIAARATPRGAHSPRVVRGSGSVSCNNAANFAAASAALRTIATHGATMSVGESLVVPSASLPLGDPDGHRGSIPMVGSTGAELTQGDTLSATPRAADVLAQSATDAALEHAIGETSMAQSAVVVIDSCSPASFPDLSPSSQTLASNLEISAPVATSGTPSCIACASTQLVEAYAPVEVLEAKMEALMTLAGFQRTDDSILGLQVGQASEDEGWDLVVERTFISAVPRRVVLSKTVSAPGRIGASLESARGRSGSVSRRRRRRGGRQGSQRADARRPHSHSKRHQNTSAATQHRCASARCE